MKTERTEIKGPLPDPCAACPWLTKNHRRKHPDGWYGDENRRRLWNGLRTGEAPGMTCHPTDPENQPTKDEQVTRECAGAIVLMQRELDAFEKAGSLPAYRKGRRLAATRGGLIGHAFAAAPFPLGRGLAGTTIHMDAEVSIGLRTDR